MPTSSNSRVNWVLWFIVLLGISGFTTTKPSRASNGHGLDPARLAALRNVTSVAISPDGRHVAYVLRVPRSPGKDENGAAWAELHLVPAAGGVSRPYLTGEVKVSAIAFTPDSRYVTYLARRQGDEEKALWAIPVGGGESRRWQEHDEGISAYSLSPDGERVAFIAREPRSDESEKARKKGYKQEIFEEDWRPNRVFVARLETAPPPATDPSLETEEEDDSSKEPMELEIEGSVSGVEWMPSGDALLLSVSPTSLVDDRYMFRRVRIVDAGSGEIRTRLENPGKLGRFTVSPDGRRVALLSAADPNDPASGRLLVADVVPGDAELRDLLPGLEGHVRDVAWRNAETLAFIADIGVETLFGEIDVASGRRTDLLASGATGDSPLLSSVRFTKDGKTTALTGESPAHPREVFALTGKGQNARRLTDSNPWLADVELARQEVVQWKARDGLELQGMLLHPLTNSAGTPPPLLLVVHGGPESHDRNGWVTSYSRPGQAAAARGFAVLYPNYRGSTGRGVEFSKLSQSDAAGAEFDDLIDAVAALAEQGIADKKRVGINGGSYGGYATAWCATRYSEQFRAGVMFVGISNKISKGLTTEIPIEDRMVHTRFDPWTRWQFSLERSPVYYVEQSRTALLIAGGTADKRVHPAQSLQLYRALKLIGKTPVRYVRYPGEGHGNAKAAARDDYTRRLLRWMEHFVAREKTELPPWELQIPALVDDDETSDEE